MIRSIGYDLIIGQCALLLEVGFNSLQPVDEVIIWAPCFLALAKENVLPIVSGSHIQLTTLVVQLEQQASSIVRSIHTTSCSDGLPIEFLIYAFSRCQVQLSQQWPQITRMAKDESELICCLIFYYELKFLTKHSGGWGDHNSCKVSILEKCIVVLIDIVHTFLVITSILGRKWPSKVSV